MSAASPHLECQTNGDCFAAQGYLHAANRFAQMDVRRRFGRGQLSSFVIADNDLLFNVDVSTRTLLSAPDGTPLEEVYLSEMDAETRASLEAYTAGVNAWLADLSAGRNGAKLSEEFGYLLINQAPPRAWEPEDSAAVGLLFLSNLMDDSAGEIAATRPRHRLRRRPGLRRRSGARVAPRPRVPDPHRGRRELRRPRPRCTARASRGPAASRRAHAARERRPRARR